MNNLDVRPGPQYVLRHNITKDEGTLHRTRQLVVVQQDIDDLHADVTLAY